MRNQFGFSLVSTIVAAAIGSLVVIGMAAAIGDMFRAQNSVSKAAEWNEFVSFIDRAAKNDQTCKAMMTGMVIPAYPPPAVGAPLTPKPASSPIPTKFKVPGNWRDQGDLASNTTEIKPDLLIGPGLKIATVMVYDSGIPATKVSVYEPGKGPPTSPDFVDYYRYMATIVISGDRFETGSDGVEKRTTGGQLRFREITMPVLVDSTNTIRYCHAEISVAEACFASGGTWNPDKDAPGDEKCIPREFCKSGGTMVESSDSSIAQDKTNEFTGTMDCPTVDKGEPYQKVKTAVATRTLPTYCSKYGCSGGGTVPVANFYTCYKCK